MRQPEAEKDDVVALPRPPFEQIGLDILHVARSDACAVDGKHFGRRVDRGELPDFRRKPPRKKTRSTGELQRRARAPAAEPLVEGGLHGCSVNMPARVELCAPVVAAAAKPPLVVFAGASAVVA